MTNETAAPGSDRGFRRLSRNFFSSSGGGGDASTSSPPAQPAQRPPVVESQQRPLTVRVISDPQVSRASSASGPSTPQAKNPVPRASTFGTFFRTPTAGGSGSASAGQSGPPAQQRPPQQGRPSSSGIITSQLPPPLPNPYGPSHVPSMPVPNGTQQSRPHSSHLPLSAPAQGQHAAPGGYAAQQNGSMNFGPAPHQLVAYDLPLPSHPQRYSMQGYPIHFQPPMPSSPPHTLQHPPNAPISPPPQVADNSDADQLEAVLQASRATADEEKRKRDDERLAEEAHYLALHESEQAERRRQEAEEEERMMLKVIEESEREEREAQAKRLERQREEEAHSQILLEESRQLALREDEERLRKQHAALLMQSKHEAEMAEQRRRQAEAEQLSMEETAMRESLQEMEEEWKRRDEEERAVVAHMQHGGRLGAPSYWQQLDQKKAYSLAVKMDTRAPAGQPVSSPVAGPSHPRRPLPLPPTPVQAALAAGLENEKPIRNKADRDLDALQEEVDHEDEVWMQSDDELMQDGRSNSGDDNDEDDSINPFGDDAEAPPTYDEVHEDRPPEAPTSIPGHIQFAPATTNVQANHNNTLSEFPDIRTEKSAAVSATYRDNSPSTTLQLPDQSSSADRLHQRRDMPLPPRPLSIEILAPLQGSPSNGMRPSDSIDSAGDRPSPSHSLAPVASPSSERDEAALNIQPSLPSPSPSAQGQETPAEFQQRAMKGTDFGYSSEPFGTTLELADGGQDKPYFPTSILLQKPKVDGSLASPSCFFSVRAPSWKALLRALAWYGNTRIEAGPEEIADHPEGIPLRIEVEFVTPSKVDASVGMRNAHVGVCFSLAYPSLADAASKNLRASLKNASRALDSAYVRQGATRRVIALPSQAPLLPLAIVRLAQHMHRAHKFSAACPSTGHTALHSPRDLHHAVERHDVGFVAKMQKKLREQGVQHPGQRISSAGGVSGGGNEGRSGRAGASSAGSMKGRSEGAAAGVSQSGAADSPQSSRFSLSLHRPSMSSVAEGERTGVDGEGRPEGGVQHIGSSGQLAVHDDDDGGDDSFVEDDLDAGAVEIADGTDRDASRMARMRARVYRRLAKRSGDSRTVDEDLESWITPYDLTQHG